MSSTIANTEESGRRLLEKFWWMIKLANDENITPLDKAKQNNTFWLVTLLNEPSLIEDKKQFDWIAACQRQETRAIFAFIDHCEDLQTVCREQNDTPLHHIEFPTYHDNQKFLKIPSIVELKNTVDDAGSTPLHRALERRNIVLSKLLLLDNDVDRTIRNLNGSTAMDLLAVLIKNDDWKQMCKLINVNPNIKTRYIQSGANLEQIRTTLSVVAALLATITFAAGFTLPGGFKSDTGKALLAKKPAFVVFLLADGVGMCSSMLVLFFLIWSLVSEPDMAHVLVDRSVYILVLSLYGTLIAFMTGIYTVIPHSSKWAAIFIIVMCSLTIISVLAFMTVQSILAYKDILHKVIVKLISKFRPLIRAACTRNQVRRPTVEEGGVAESLTENDVFNRT